MTKKHFQAFADVIKALENREDAGKMAGVCIAVFRDDNPRFDASRFLDACNLTPAEVR